jgi:hypothetical protein
MVAKEGTKKMKDTEGVGGLYLKATQVWEGDRKEPELRLTAEDAEHGVRFEAWFLAVDGWGLRYAKCSLQAGYQWLV